MTYRSRHPLDRPGLEPRDRPPRGAGRPSGRRAASGDRSRSFGLPSPPGQTGPGSPLRRPSPDRSPGASGGPTAAPPDGPDPVLGLPAALARRPVSVLIHGPSRDLVNLVTYGLTAWVGSEFAWIDVRIGRQAPSGMNPVHLGMIPAERLVVVHRLEEMGPSRVEREAVRAVIRTDEPADSLAKLADFVRLPRPVQLALAKTVPGPTAAVVVVSNAHRLVALYDAASVPELLREVTTLGASVFVSFADEPPRRRSAFDFVFAVHGESSDRWPEAVLEIERATGMPAEIHGHRVSVGEVEPLGRLLRDAIARSRSSSPPS